MNCNLCHKEMKRCDECIQMPNDFSEIYDFPVLNPIQSKAYKNLDDDCLLASSGTGSGKTLIYEMKLQKWYDNRKDDDEFSMVLVPYTLLAHEQVKKWSKRFSEMNILELTGKTKMDVIKNSKYKGSINQILAKEMREWDVIVASYEMFSSFTSKDYEMLSKLTLLCIDEIHTICDPTRGSQLDSGLTRFLLQHSDDTKVIGLSATFDNLEDLEKYFIKYGFNPTMIETDWKPVKVTFNEPIIYSRSKERNQIMKELIIDKMSDYGKILSVILSRKAVDSISYGIREDLGEDGISLSHHAGKSTKQKRERIERYQNDNSVKNLIATPTIANGVNLKGDTIILDTCYYNGLKNQKELLSKMDIMQISGRAGRPQHSKDKTAEVNLLTECGMRRELEHLMEKPITVNGQLYKKMKLSLLMELNKRKSATQSELDRWLEYSYSEVTSSEPKKLSESILYLESNGFIEESEDSYKNTPKGKATGENMVQPELVNKVINICEEIDDEITSEDYTTEMMLNLAKIFYDFDETQNINDLYSKLMDMFSYEWIFNPAKTEIKWGENPPLHYDIYDTVMGDFGRMNRVLEKSNSDLKSLKLIEALSKMLPYEMFKLKKELAKYDVGGVGRKRLFVLWMNGVRPDELHDIPSNLKYPKSVKGRIGHKSITETEIEIKSHYPDNKFYTYPKGKWEKDRKKVENSEKSVDDWMEQFL